MDRKSWSREELVTRWHARRAGSVLAQDVHIVLIGERRVRREQQNVFRPTAPLVRENISTHTHPSGQNGLGRRGNTRYAPAATVFGSGSITHRRGFLFSSVTPQGVCELRVCFPECDTTVWVVLFLSFSRTAYAVLCRGDAAEARPRLVLVLQAMEGRGGDAPSCPPSAQPNRFGERRATGRAGKRLKANTFIAVKGFDMAARVVLRLSPTPPALGLGPAVGPWTPRRRPLDLLVDTKGRQ